MEYQELLLVIKNINRDIGKPEYDEILSSILALAKTYPLQEDRVRCQEQIERLILQKYMRG